jgi:hypothetical protein
MRKTLGAFSVVVMAAVSIGSAVVSKSYEEVPPLRKRGLYVHIEMEKSEYKRYEAIPVTSWIENTTKKIQYYNSYDRLTIHVFSLSGGSAETCGPQIADSRFQLVDKWGKPVNNYIALSPRESTPQSTRDLLNFCGFGRGWDCYYLPAGDYYITCPANQSDTRFFTVVEPDDRTELGATALLDSALAQHQVFPGLKAKRSFFMANHLQRYRLLAELLDSFPRMYLSERAYRFMQQSKGYLLGNGEWKDSLSSEDRKVIEQHVFWRMQTDIDSAK